MCEVMAKKEIWWWSIIILKLFLPEASGIENLANGKTAFQKSDFRGSATYGAQVAVDNVVTQAWPNIATTGFDKDVYWYVDLGDLRNIYNVTIYYRRDSSSLSSPVYASFVSRFSGFVLFISTKDPTTKGGYDCRANSTSPPLLYAVPCAAVGRYVTIHNHRADGTAILDLGEVQVFGCNSPNVYGDSCSSSCNSNCFNRWCMAKNGSCFSCIDGYRGSYCSEPCQDGSYGTNCSRTCNPNCIDSLNCNHINGSCVGGCKTGWKGEMCNQPCENGKHGPNCIYDCGNCQSGSTCDRRTGECTACIPGYYPPLCVNQCENGTYGQNCTSTCTWNCQNNETCNFDNGHCPNICADGWRGPKCDTECQASSYGPQCLSNCSENCKGGPLCHHITGACNDGCKNGFYGQICSHTCSANCRNSSSCNPDNGVCDSGCDNGFYGLNCTMICSINCKINGTCDQVSGSCSGCIAGWKSSQCDTECGSGEYGENCVGKCGGCLTGTTCSIFTGECASGCDDGYTGSLCAPEVSNVGPIAAGVSGGVAVLLVICITVICIIIRRRKPEEKYLSTSHPTEGREESGSSTNLWNRTSGILGMTDANEYVNPNALNNDLEDNPEDEEVDENMYLNVDDIRKYEDIPIENLQTEIQNMSKEENAAFLKEYETIPKGEEHPCTAGKIPENTKKNRFISTFPYDHSRIILKKTEEKDSDYINASYIENVDGQRRYIAAQGPKRNTDVDFWKMIWQENVHKIVIVTNLKEGVKEKCVQYWPNAGQSVTKGEIEIWTENEKMYAFYAIRKLKILHKKSKEERVIHQFHYTQWKDHDVPDPLGLVIFHRHVKRTTIAQKSSLTLVHCSAGIGRTGTYIALDALYQYGEINHKVNIPGYVKIMRKDRMSMIQTVDQYIAVYKALHEAFRSKDDVIPREKFHEHVDAQNNPDKPANSIHFRTGYNGLKSLKPQYSQKEYKGGNQNSEANFTKTVLPVEKFRCKLPSFSKGRGDYYNAVFIQSYTRKDGLICAQFPLIPYTEDFLRLVYDFECHIVVSVKPLSEIESTSIWMPSKGSSVTVGDFTVSLNSTSEICSSVKTTVLSLNKKECEERTVQIFESNSWITKDTQSSDLLNALELVTQVKKANSSKDDCVMAVLSGDGASKCGVFCTIFNALQEMQMDNEVDIFTIARQLQIRRPEMFSNMDEYQFCFKTVDMYLKYHPEDKEDLYMNSEDWYAEVS